MCEYDGYWEPISDKDDMRIRKKQHCGSCCRDFPPGSIMSRHVGKFEGELQTNYTCATCNFLHDQDDTTALHVCAGDACEDSESQRVYEYARMCLEEGEAPIATVALMLREEWVERTLHAEEYA